MSFCLLLLFLQINLKEGDRWCQYYELLVFFFLLLQLLGPSFFRLISKKEAPLSLPRAFDTSKKSNIFRREREQIFFFRRGNDTRDTTFYSLSLLSPLWRSHSHKIDHRLDDRAGDHPMRRSFALFERGRRSSSSSRSTTTRESKRERKRGKKKKHSEATRETKGSKNSWVRHIFFSFMKFFEALKRKRTSRITQQPGRARVR